MQHDAGHIAAVVVPRPDAVVHTLAVAEGSAVKWGLAAARERQELDGTFGALAVAGRVGLASSSVV
ncbi:hypothetical protein GCM10011309_03600 [Litorimonas cladophorae]|uniref:Uncharacterized protein n=1 Tax=Litorimonas cladophorae TaxID=1220491 RepID=A0A918NCM7_9PROT|nr:hypothetical protein GCM10011309_03600 [Litorimonas cladophorae]